MLREQGEAMQITDVHISLRNEEKLKGFVKIVLDNEFIVKDIKIINGDERYFISMPSHRVKGDHFSDTVFPIKSDFRRKMEEVILTKYWELIAGRQKDAELPE